jgi:hypothetical protein
MLIYLRTYVYTQISDSDHDTFVSSLNVISQTMIKIVSVKVQEGNDEAEKSVIMTQLRTLTSILKRT